MAGMTAAKAAKFLSFLQNGNVVVIRDEEGLFRFELLLKDAGLLSLLPRIGDSLRAICHFFGKSGGKVNHPGWDGRTVYAECQIGKESIGIYPYDARAVTAWYGSDPLEVDDIYPGR